MRSTIDTKRQPTPMIRTGQAQQAEIGSGYLETLERRLADGYARIEDANLRGQDVTAWEEFWIDLLHQYEAAVDDLPEAA
ncbi:MAG: hypothetical protein M3490_01585 [Chloroflexota bacterium]|nr:hypothetical protein [Chloroflexia bacterium]MDQ3442289.1 hypothetical protein [Chloroflexota bacterium]